MSKEYIQIYNLLNYFFVMATPKRCYKGTTRNFGRLLKTVLLVTGPLLLNYGLKVKFLPLQTFARASFRRAMTKQVYKSCKSIYLHYLYYLYRTLMLERVWEDPLVGSWQVFACPSCQGCWPILETETFILS